MFIKGDNMDDLVLNSQEELYNRIRPALRSKRRLLRQCGFTSVRESDIWNFLRMNKWLKSSGLELCDMVDDILHAKNEEIVNYCYSKYMNNNENKNTIEDINGIMLPKLKS